MICMLDQGERITVTRSLLHAIAADTCDDVLEVVVDPVIARAWRELYDGISRPKIEAALLRAARILLQQDSAYERLTAHLWLRAMRREVIGGGLSQDEMVCRYPRHLVEAVSKGIATGRLDRRLGEFDLRRLGSSLRAERDLRFQAAELEMLYGNCLLQVDGRRIELPQSFLMRIAMGLALNEADREGKAIKLYNLLSSLGCRKAARTLFAGGKFMAVRNVAPACAPCG